jgi:hypothetical protein
MKAKMLALTIVPTRNKKPKLAFHVGFNPTQSELIMIYRERRKPTTNGRHRSLTPLSPTP